MRQRIKAVQGDLFEPDSAVLQTTPEEREHLISLLSALVLEVMTNPETTTTPEDDHEPDHS